MSWGERSCKHYFNGTCPDDCSIGNCNVDCKSYDYDGVTTPDSVTGESIVKVKKTDSDTYVKIENPDTPQQTVKEKQIPIKTIGGKKCLDLHRLSNAELLEVAAHFKVTIINKHRREMIRKLEKHGPFVFNK